MHTHNRQHGAPSGSQWLERLPQGVSKTFARGDVISRPESGPDQIFSVQAGEARVFLPGGQKELTLGWLKSGSLYVTHTRAWIEALSPVTLQCWPMSALHALLSSQPGLAMHALREVGQMLHQATNLIEDLAFRSVEQRLARYLLLEYSDQGKPAGGQVRLTGHTELLASLLGTSRQTLSSLINRLIKAGVLERIDRQHLRICDHQELQHLSAS